MDKHWSIHTLCHCKYLYKLIHIMTVNRTKIIYTHTLKH